MKEIPLHIHHALDHAHEDKCEMCIRFHPLAPGLYTSTYTSIYTILTPTDCALDLAALASFWISSGLRSGERLSVSRPLSVNY